MAKWRDVSFPFYCIDEVEIRAPQKSICAKVERCALTFWLFYLFDGVNVGGIGSRLHFLFVLYEF